MSKKLFKETKVGKFIIEKVPSILGIVGDAILPGNVISELISGNKDLSEADKEIALEKLKIERVEIDGTTKRWVADVQSGSFLSSNVRPLTLIALTFAMILGYFMEIPNLELLTDMGKIVFLGYFGGRSTEKIFGNKLHNR